ncbi:MAG: DUF1858 domain-containing protein [Candidatus Hydrogenedentes bacterium]|nr:DUF1858 domain-containing protein [Candidatus Hydrogenedentota bacterium]
MLEAQDKYFRLDMPVAEAMAMHPRAAEVFAAFHLGGCSHCGVAHYETIEQVCMGYGVDSEVLLEVLEGLMEHDPQESVAATSTASTETTES